MKDFNIPKGMMWLYGGYWAQMLARHLLHKPPITPDEWFAANDHFDIEDQKLGAMFEVKLANNSSQIRIKTSQVAAQIEELGFPIGDGVMWLFSYVSRPGHHEGRDFSKEAGDSWKKLCACLSRRLHRVDAVDMKLIDARRRSKDGAYIARSGKWNIPKEMVKINRRDLDRIAKNPKVELLNLEVSKNQLRRWVPSREESLPSCAIETTFEGNKVEFRQNLILPQYFRQRFVAHLNGAVRRIET